MRIPFTTSKGDFIGILVPDNAKEFTIEDGELCLWEIPPSSDMIIGTIDLPECGFEKIELCCNITELIANDIVEIDELVSGWEDENDIFYKDYTKGEKDYLQYTPNALESFRSLMKSLNMTDGNWLILRRIFYFRV